MINSLSDFFTNNKKETSESTPSKRESICPKYWKFVVKNISRKRNCRTAYVALGSLIRVDDSQWKTLGPKLVMAVSAASSIKYEQSFKTPEDWEHFLVLANRLKLGLVTGVGSTRAQKCFDYFEKLVTAKKEGLSSINAIIAFDERNRKKNAGSWKWLRFDVFDFLLVVQHFAAGSPLSSPATNQLVPQPGQAKKPQNDKTRTKMGFAGLSISKTIAPNCRFAHWCINP